jgi:endonuclease-3
MADEKTKEIFSVLRELFGETPKVELDYKTEIDLLVAIILSAQCTDKRVNAVTKDLFKKYRTVADYADADVKEFENEIHSCGFYHNKTKNIINMARAVVAQFGGKIPADIQELVKLPGVGRKTASVFLAEQHKLPAIAVDTHVIRVSGRLGLTKSKNPEIIERDLMQLIDKKDWRLVNIYLVLFGRYYCKAQKPQCNECKLKKHCEFRQ